MAKNISNEKNEDHGLEKLRRKNMIFAIVMGIFVVALGVISYFRIKGLTP